MSGRPVKGQDGPLLLCRSTCAEWAISEAGQASLPAATAGGPVRRAHATGGGGQPCRTE